MDRPLQAILIAGEKARDEVIQGHKTTTIRLGWRSYHTGMCVVCCHVLNWCVGVRIVQIDHYVFKDIPLKLLRKNGYKNFENALEEMKKIYPSIEPNSPVTCVEWERT